MSGICLRFAKVRDELGLTQRQVAESLGITDQTVSNWERGLHPPRLLLGQVSRLCVLLGRDVHELIELFEIVEEAENGQ